MKIKSLATPFIYLTLLTLLPVIIGTYLFFNHQKFKFKTVNHGILITPVVNISQLHTVIPDENKWRMVYVYDAHCDQQCKIISRQLNAIKKIANKDRDRTNVILINKDFVDLNQHLQTKLDTVTNKIYLVDPIGNIFMYYPAVVNPMDILKDLKRLLEVSQIG